MKWSFVLLMMACAPSVPSELPTSSPASEAAQSAPLPPAGVAAREDPPLPGEDTSRWSGLSSSTQHSMHDMSNMQHSMPGMDMSGMQHATPMDAGMKDSGMPMQHDSGGAHGH